MMDVKLLCTNIPNSGYSSGKKRIRQLSKVITKVITAFLALILTLNNFIFNCNLYLQIKGCAIGTIWTPAYANKFTRQIHEIRQNRFFHQIQAFQGFSRNFLIS